MQIHRTRAVAMLTVLVTVLGAAVASAQDKYAVKVPGGLAFSEFRGYEQWELISVSQGDKLFAAILGNPAMIAAYESGTPANRRSFPDGAKMAKIHWVPKQSAPAPSPTNVPDATCGFGCHTIVQSSDYVFIEYGPR